MQFLRGLHPTHWWVRYVSTCPQNACPSDDSVATSKGRQRDEPEYAPLDAGVFEHHRRFEAPVDFAQADPDDTCHASRWAAQRTVRGNRLLRCPDTARHSRLSVKA